MLCADRIIDMGPGPGARGGSIVFDGNIEQLSQADTLTGAYLGGRQAGRLRLQAHGDRARRGALDPEGMRASTTCSTLDIEFPLYSAWSRSRA